MRIDGINKLTQAYGMQTQGCVINKKINQKDEIQLSTVARDFQYASKMVKQVPDIREEKVNEIRARIEAGTYSIDAKKVSEKIVSQMDLQA